MATTEEEELEQIRAGTGMGGRLRNLYAEDETEVAKLRQAQREDDEMATAVGRWRAAQRLFGGTPEGPAPKISTASERLQEESALRSRLGARRQEGRETSGLEAYLQRQGMSPEDAAVTARSKVAQDAWRTGQDRTARREDAQAQRDWQAGQAKEDRDWRTQESARNRSFQRELAGAKASEARAANEQKAREAAQKGGSDLRKEFEGRATTQAYRQSKIELAKIEELVKNPNAATDLALVFSFMKALDPGSVVRESEFSTAQNAAGAFDRLQNQVNRLKSGQILNPQQRAEFVGAARAAVQAVGRAYEDQAQRYGRLASEYGIPVEHVLGADAERYGGGSSTRPARGGNVDLTQGTGGLTAEDQAALDWARSNPDDPRAAEIVQRLGGR